MRLIPDCEKVALKRVDGVVELMLSRRMADRLGTSFMRCDRLLVWDGMGIWRAKLVREAVVAGIVGRGGVLAGEYVFPREYVLPRLGVLDGHGFNWAR